MTLTYHVVPVEGTFDVVERNLVTGDWREVFVASSRAVAERVRDTHAQREADQLLREVVR